MKRERALTCRTRRPRAFVPGVVLPLALALLVVFNLVTEQALYPARLKLLTGCTDMYRLAGAVVVELVLGLVVFLGQNP